MLNIPSAHCSICLSPYLQASHGATHVSVLVIFGSVGLEHARVEICINLHKFEMFCPSDLWSGVRWRFENWGISQASQQRWPLTGSSSVSSLRTTREPIYMVRNGLDWSVPLPFGTRENSVWTGQPSFNTCKACNSMEEVWERRRISKLNHNKVLTFHGPNGAIPHCKHWKIQLREILCIS